MVSLSPIESFHRTIQLEMKGFCGEFLLLLLLHTLWPFAGIDLRERLQATKHGSVVYFETHSFIHADKLKPHLFAAAAAAISGGSSTGTVGVRAGGCVCVEQINPSQRNVDYYSSESWLCKILLNPAPPWR